MAALRKELTDDATYRRLAYLLSAFPLGQVWFVALVTVWSLCLGFLITPLVIPLLIGMAVMTRGFATVEAAVANALLDVDVHVPVSPQEQRFWTRFRARFGAGFWKQQGYLFLRWIAGLTVGVLVFSLLAAGLGMLVAPLWIPFVHGGSDLGFWRVNTFWEALAFVPAGAILLPLTLLVVKPIAQPFRSLAVALLGGGEDHRMPATTRTPSGDPWRAVREHGLFDAILIGVPIVIWLATSRGYFWPIWIALPLGSAFAIHAWVVAAAEDPNVRERFLGSRALAETCGVAAIIGTFFVLVWAITGAGYFWPIWILLPLAAIVAAHAGTVRISSHDEAELTERIETLETSRAGAVDAQDTELRRIERDLHDGAQARLVALGMSLGMAEQKLANDPTAAGALLAEARAGAEEALRELRDLARGIHPPVLADRGLEAALRALISATPIQVGLSASVGERPPPAVETAAYFVAAEGLANAAKHARASRVDIRIVRAGDLLVLEIVDNGVGGADPSGAGLVGLRQRVDALDGTLTITSPRGGPTTLRAELPCA